MGCLYRNGIHLSGPHFEAVSGRARFGVLFGTADEGGKGIPQVAIHMRIRELDRAGSPDEAPDERSAVV